MSETFRTGSFADGKVTVLANQILQDSRLSYRARGLAAAAISFPHNWDWSAERLAKSSPGEGRDAIRTALKELEEHGYLQRTRVQNDRGHWSWTWKLKDTAVDVSAGRTEDGISGTGKSTPKTAHPSSVPPGQTDVPAGRTEDGSSEVGSAVFLLKEDLPKEYEETNISPHRRSNSEIEESTPDGRDDDEKTGSETPTEPQPPTQPVQTVLDGLDWGRHPRPTKNQEEQLYGPLKQALDLGWAEAQLVDYCNAAIARAKDFPGKYLINALGPQWLGLPPKPASSKPHTMSPSRIPDTTEEIDPEKLKAHLDEVRGVLKTARARRRGHYREGLPA